MNSVKYNYCKDCGTGVYNMSCIKCLARWILRLDKSQRLRSIETQGKHDIDELKAEIIRIDKQ